MLKSFVLRASDDALAPDDLLTSLATQLANKPPPEWADADEDQFQVRVAHVARAFRSAESLLVGRDENVWRAGFAPPSCRPARPTGT